MNTRSIDECDETPLVTCTECERQIAPHEEWVVAGDGRGGQRVFCEDCWGDGEWEDA